MFTLKSWMKTDGLMQTLDTEEPEHKPLSEAQKSISDSDKLLLELLKSMTPETKDKLLKESLSYC